MRKRIVIIFIVLISLCSLSGCYVDIDRQVMIAGVAIDEGRQGKKYHVSVETISPTSKEIETNIIEIDGDTVFEALRDFIAVSSKKLYFGHCKAMFISEKLARKGIGEILDITIRDSEARIEMDVIITKGCDAACALKSGGVFSPIISYKVDDLFDTPEKGFGDAPAVHSYHVYNDINSEGVSVVISAFEIVNATDDKKELKLYGTGVFDKDKLVGYLDKDETRNLSIINDKLHTGLLTYPAADATDSFASYEIYSNKCKRDLEFDNDSNKITVNISTRTAVSIGEIESYADFTKNEDVEKIRSKLESEIEEDLYKLITKSQSELGCDIFGIGRQIYRDYPEAWEKCKKGWNETYKTIDFNVDCKVKLTGSGIFKKGSLHNSA